MPTYIYFCSQQNCEFEEWHSIKIELEECPICKEKNMPQHKPKRLIAGGSGKGSVVLTGHELTAKLKDDTAKLAKEVYSSEQKYANILGDTKYNEIQTRMDKNKKGY